ncbi:MAG: shikimate dehydrogenase, partial [Chlamydiales bacterium]
FKIPFPIHTSEVMLFLTVNSLKEGRESLYNPSIDGIELRLDRFETIDFTAISALLLDSPLPFLFTLRKATEGGKFFGSEEERFVLIEQLMQLTPSFFDLEYDIPAFFLKKMRKKHPSVKLILSYHNFENTVDIEKQLAKMSSPHAFGYKIACHVNSSLDALRICTSIQDKNVALLGMGRLGEITRILSPVTGNLFNYASRAEDSSPAGQLPVSFLDQVYHYRILTKNTACYALIGDPVEMSPSHITHNRVFERLGIDAVYVKIPIKREELSAFFSFMNKVPIRGVSITMPHKECSLPLLDQIDQEACTIGAVNTVQLKKGKLCGTNTDGSGALDALETKISVRGKRIVILGAGGTAKAIAFHAKQRGAEVIILNRTALKAESLARELQCIGGGLEKIAHLSYDILINATSVGMSGVAECPIDPKTLLPKTVVLDAVMRETLLLQEAAKRECTCLNGKELFLHQAVRQFMFWFPGIDTERVKTIMKEEL